MRIYVLLTLSILSCKSSNSDKIMEKETMVMDEKSTEQINMETNQISLLEIFFQQEVNNGFLLSGSDSLLISQIERAKIFVPMGGGMEETTSYEKEKFDDNYLKIKNKDNGVILEYALYTGFSSDNAVILKLENNRLLEVIKYSFSTNTLNVSEITSLLPKSILINKNSNIVFKSRGINVNTTELLWEENQFILK